MSLVTGDIIGREDELSVVNAFLDGPTAGLRALVLEGEAGIGKSTLWLAGVAAARERSFQVLISRPAETERTLAHVVLGDLFAETGPESLGALSAPRRRAFESALLREESDVPVDARALGVAILTLLPVLAERQPLVLAIDDDQWMDSSSAATLRFALRRSLQHPVLLLLSRRVDGASPTALEESIDPAAIERLRLGPMSVGAILVLLRRRLGITIPRPALLQLHEASGGNPFYALELARARSADPARAATVPWVLPAALDQIVGARLDGLGERDRQALLLIAAHGRMPVGLLRALDVAPETLDHARDLNVVATADGVVRFTHPLLASAVYHGAANEDRRAAHRTLAAVSEDAVQRGRHLALGADEPSADLAAVLESAATALRDRGMPLAAADLLEHAVRLTTSEAVDDRQRRSIAAARAYLEAGEGGRAHAIADDLLARAPTGRRRAEVLILASDLAEPGPAVMLLERALVEAAGVAALEARIHIGLASGLSFTKGHRWAEPHVQASLRLADQLDDDALRAHALSMLAYRQFGCGAPDALDLAERAYRLARPLADPRHVKAAGFWVGYLLVATGDNDRARDWLEAWLDEWSDRDEEVRADALYYLALVELWSGRWSIAARYIDEAGEIFIQYGRELPQALFPPALLALHRGDFAAARAHSSGALTMGPQPLPLPQFHGVLGICDSWSGNPSGALESFIRAEEAANTRGWGEPNMRWWRAEYVEALLRLGRIDDAIGLLNEWETAAGRLGRERTLAQVSRCRGLIAAARGDLADARDLLEAAVDRHGAVGDPFGQARALLALGEVRRRAKQKRSARTALESALVGFEALGAPSWADTARAELARIGGRERIEGLSPSELRVAELVAEGRTNREIAAALFLGERTVASHLTHIYAKLGIRSRTELVRHALAEPSTGAATNIPTS